MSGISLSTCLSIAGNHVVVQPFEGGSGKKKWGFQICMPADKYYRPLITASPSWGTFKTAKKHGEDLVASCRKLIEEKYGPPGPERLVNVLDDVTKPKDIGFQKKHGALDDKRAELERKGG